jgi:hypothetical protein
MLLKILKSSGFYVFCKIYNVTHSVVILFGWLINYYFKIIQLFNFIAINKTVTGGNELNFYLCHWGVEIS